MSAEVRKIGIGESKESGLETRYNLRIPQATKKGFIEVEPNGAFDFSYPDSKTRRGRVQMGGAVSPTLTCSTEIYVYEVIFKE